MPSALPSHGAKVVVNDLGGNIDGSGGDLSPAEQVVQEIKGMGGEAVANGDSVSSWEGAQRLINTAIETFGDLHAVVNNAGILRDRMLTNMTEEEWDAVINVHLKGTFAPSRWAAAYWREQAKAGKPVDGRIINTTSVSGIYGNPGQTNYGAAKAGIAAFTNIAALELAPLRRHRQCGRSGRPDADDRRPRPGTRDRRGARDALATVDRADRHVVGVRGVERRHRTVFEASGNVLAIAEGWVRGPRQAPLEDAAALGPVVRELLAKARPNSGMDGEPGGWPQPGPAQAVQLVLSEAESPDRSRLGRRPTS